MNHSCKKHISALILGGSLLALPQSAFALDGETLIKRYQDTARDQGQKFTYGSIENSGDGFVVKQPTWTVPDLAPIKGETAQFSSVKENDDGSITIGSVDVNAITAGSGDISVTFDTAAIKGLRIPKQGESDPIKKIAYYTNFDATNGIVKYKGKVVATFPKTTLEMSPFNTETTMTMNAAMNDIALDLSSVEDPSFKKGLSDLGYDGKFTGRMAMQGDWSGKTGDMNLSVYDLVIDNVGTLSFPFSVAGYTAERVAKMQQLVKETEGTTDPAEQQRAAMQMFDGLELKSAAITFKDDSLTKRGLELASKQMQQPPESLAAAAPMMIGMGMANLKMPEVTQMVSTAVGKFLQNPGTLSFSVQPQKPTPIMDLIAAGTAAPQSLPGMLNLKVEAR